MYICGDGGAVEVAGFAVDGNVFETGDGGHGDAGLCERRVQLGGREVTYAVTLPYRLMSSDIVLMGSRVTFNGVEVLS